MATKVKYGVSIILGLAFFILPLITNAATTKNIASNHYDSKQAQETNRTITHDVNVLLEPLSISSLLKQQRPQNTLITHIRNQHQYGAIQFESGYFNVNSNKLDKNIVYLQGSFSLMSNENYHIAMLANIEQVNDEFIYHTTDLLNDDVNTKVITNTRLALTGRFLVTPKWQIIGSLSTAKNNKENTSTYLLKDNNMAVIGTTYSF